MNIKVGGMNSESFVVTQGVHQGGPLSGLLFEIYIDELIQILKNSPNGMHIYDHCISCVAYADDIALCSNTENGLQELINIAVKYAKKWKFKFNPKKCEVMYFGKSSREPQIFIDNTMLKVVEESVYLGTHVTKNKKLENQYVEKRIREAYKKAWQIKSVGSRRVQINPITFSRGFSAVVIPSLLYGYNVIRLSKRNLKSIDQMQINVAKNIQGLSSNTPAVVALAGMKWKRLSTHIVKESVNFMFKTLQIPNMCIYKELLIYGLLEAKHKGYTNLGSNPVSYIIEQCRKCNVLREVEEIITGFKIDFQNKSFYKNISASKLSTKESSEWVATTLLYRSLVTFRECHITIDTGYKWWKIAKLNNTVLYKVKTMFRLLVTNNDKCGYKCKCNSQMTVEHIVFDCNVVNDVRKIYLDRVIDVMPKGMKENFICMSSKEKVKFIYSCLNCNVIFEWLDIYINIIDMVYMISKAWYSKLNIEI